MLFQFILNSKYSSIVRRIQIILVISKKKDSNKLNTIYVVEYSNMKVNLE
jgi:hypothetical protein